MKKKRYRKPYKKKPIKPFYKKKWFWSLVSTIFFLASFGYILFLSPLFQIQEVIVLGSDKEEMLNEAKGDLLKSIFLVNLSETRGNLIDKFPEIKRVTTKRILPDKVEIIIEERSPLAVWCYNDCYFIDKDGVIFGQPEEPFKLAIIRGGRDSKSPLSKEEATFILELWQEIKETVNIKEVYVKENEIDLITNEKWIIKTISSEKSSLQAEKLRLVLNEKISEQKRKELEYIDLRFENSVYYR